MMEEILVIYPRMTSSNSAETTLDRDWQMLCNWSAY